MKHRSLPRRASRIATWALLLAVATCTEGPVSLTKTWITPTGQVTANPPVVLVGAGDIGSCSSTGDEQTANLLDGIPGTVFNIGDNVYENGTTTEYANCYHPNWGRHKGRTKPSPGNHEYNTANASGYFGYFGAAAGDPAKGWYSYDVGDWHIIVLNSSGGTAGPNPSMATGSPQELWLKADLAANSKLCTLAYWHHPLYRSTGGTGSGGVTTTKVRPMWDALYAAGADVVVNGHWHAYERHAPQKPDRSTDPVHGIRQFMAGTGGVGHHDVTNVSRNSEVRNSTAYGVLKLWLYEDSYAWKFVPVTGQTFSDSGSTACHGAPGSGSAVSAAQSTVAASPTSLTAGSDSTTITVTVKNASGSPISGATVVLAATGTGNTLTQPSSPTNANGVATGTLRSTVAQSKTISASVTGTAITQTTTITVTVEAVSATQSTVSAAPTSVTTGSQGATITVTVKDANGAPISGATVVLAATGSENTLTQPSGTTDEQGRAVGILSSTMAAQKIVSATATVGTVTTAIDQTATVTVNPAAVTADLSVTKTDGLTSVNQGSTVTYTIVVSNAGPSAVTGATVNDAFPAQLSGVSWSCTASAGSACPASGTGSIANAAVDLASGGVATFTASGTVVGTGTLANTATVTAPAGVNDPAGNNNTTDATTVIVASAAITHTLLTQGNDQTNQRIYSTAAISPAPNTLITVAVMGHQATNVTPSPTLSGGGMAAWTEVATITFDAIGLPHKRLTIYRAMSAAPGSGPITITFSTTVSHSQWIVSQWDGVDLNGVNGAGAIGQTGSTRGDAVSGLTVPLAPFASANNVAYGVFGVRSQTLAVTPGAGFTEISEQPSAESPPSGVEALWARNSNTITALWNALNAGALGVEIRARTTGP